MKEILHYRVRVFEDHTVEYVLKQEILYDCMRYNKSIFVPYNEVSDGATGAFTRLGSLTHWVHDKVCKKPYWTDGTPVTAWQAAFLLYEIHQDEARQKREHGRKVAAIIAHASSYTWFIATFLFGCKKARANGWF